MNLYYSILVAIWLAVVYAIWAATIAGDPGFGQAAFLAGGIFATLYLIKRNKERPQVNLDEIEIPEAEFSVDIEYEAGKYFFSEKSYRRIIWFSNIFALVSISLFLETIMIRKYILWGVLSLVLGMIVFTIPILLPVKDDITTLRKRAKKERIKAWSKGKSSPPNEEE
jgi:ABC-type branched-subunit amino acid transport system permease subunit